MYKLQRLAPKWRMNGTPLLWSDSKTAYLVQNRSLEVLFSESTRIYKLNVER